MGGGEADCVWERRLIPTSLPSAAALHRWARMHAQTHTRARMHTHTHTHTLCQREKSTVECWNPFSNTLEDHAKHKVRELGCIPLFPTPLRPLELCHQLINEHNALSSSRSLSICYLELCFLFNAAAQKFESLVRLGEWMCYVCSVPSVCSCMDASSIWTRFIMVIVLKICRLFLVQQGNTSCFQPLWVQPVSHGETC